MMVLVATINQAQRDVERGSRPGTLPPCTPAEQVNGSSLLVSSHSQRGSWTAGQLLHQRERNCSWDKQS